MSANVQLIPGTLPPGFCPTSEQERYNLYFLLATGLLPGNYSTFNFGDSTPGVDDQDKPWIRTIGGKLDGLYSFFNGGWYRPHEIPAGSTGFVCLWEGAAADIATYDGGDNVAVTDYSGPFWEIITTWAAKMPIGVGTLPGGTVVNVGDTGGSDEQTLALTNMPPHRHTVPANTLIIVGSGGGGTAGSTFKNNDGTENLMNLTGGNSDGTTEPFDIMPPYRGVYFIRRTARIYRGPV